jgi:hypothetical protein
MALGRKTGGRKKGSRNRAAIAREKAIAASGVTPLDFMLGVMRDERASLDLRFEAARSAAPYVHPKLASVAHGGKLDLGIAARLDAALKRLRADVETRTD